MCFSLHGVYPAHLGFFFPFEIRDDYGLLRLCCSKQVQLYLVFSLVKDTLKSSLILALFYYFVDIINPKDLLGNRCQRA